MKVRIHKNYSYAHWLLGIDIELNYGGVKGHEYWTIGIGLIFWTIEFVTSQQIK